MRWGRLCSFPDPERNSFLGHERVAARAAARMLPGLDEMLGRDRSGGIDLPPFKLARHRGFRSEQAVAQPHRGNFRARAGGKLARQFLVPGLTPHPRKDVEQIPALMAVDGLHVAIQAAVRTAGNVGVILALRALEMIRPAHGFQSGRNRKQIQGAAGPVTRGDTRRMNSV